MFGQNKPGQQTGFAGFGNPATTSAASSSGFSFGAISSALGSTTGTGFSFGTASSQPSASIAASTGQTQGFTGFSLGSATTKPTIFGAGPTISSTATGSSFGQASVGLGLGTATTSAAVKPTGTGFNFGLQQSSQPSAASTTTSSLSSAFGSLGQTATSSAAPAFGSLGAAATVNKTTAAASTGGFSFGTAQPTASTQSSTLNLGSTLPATQKTTATTGFTFGQTAAATTQPTLLPGAQAQPASTSSTTLGILGGKTTTAAQPHGLQTTTTLTTKSATAIQPSTSTASAATATAEKPMSYKQLEDVINKWVHELDEQETVFLNQAKQINVWDRLLVENGMKITQLNGEIQRLKTDQGRLDRELDFILSQQQELEEVLAPMEEHIKSQQSIPYMQHSDLEREKTYKMAENIDSQLKRMMQDIKDIINHINTSNTNVKESDDPMTQIAKILNSHMDSLQWVDQNAALLQRKVEDVTKQVETRRREHERSLRLTFD